MPASITLDAVIETPRGSRNKFKFDAKHRQHRLGSVLPAGLAFPYDFGFIPDTKGADGDPIDVLILMDEPAFPGCVVTVRLIGALKAEQSEDRKTLRNDRLVAVAEEAHDWRHVRTLSDLDDHLLNELEQFFVSYNRTRGKKFKLLGTCGPKGAVKLLDKAKAKPKAR